MRKIIPINNGWEFTPAYTEPFARGEGGFATVDLPHTCRETPYHYFDESLYQMVCGYRRWLDVGDLSDDRRLFVCFGAAAHYARVYADGILIGEHKGGYTAFELELTDSARGKDKILLAVELDTRESLNIPPFGHVIDYMTYGGLYREVRLELRSLSYLSDVFAMPQVPDTVMLNGTESSGQIAAVNFTGRIIATAEITGEADQLRLSLYPKDSDAKLCEQTFDIAENYEMLAGGARLWDVLSPALYTLRAELIKDGRVIDRLSRRVGFRRAVFKADGFYLNGRRLKIVGLNRHQSYPYVGYAMPRSMQRYDADILKYELGLNAVRTSHYPQSHHFIGRCDELGLLVFTEIPGWQHIGDSDWKDVAVMTTGEMVAQYRNHPSIILWGVRINESADDDAFYTRTNEVAHRLDPSRPTGGVRCYKKGSFLEDVYTYNDFSHDGIQPGCEPKRAVTPDTRRAYLISEYNGHMYPTKAFDDEEHRVEHAMRHRRVLRAVAARPDIAGSFGWCFFDYNTHRDFGSGDRVCYHGVCDMFRNPKLAAAPYAARREGAPLLCVSSAMDIGEHPASVRGRIYAFTNADSVKLYKNDVFIREYPNTDGMIEITDFVGDRVAQNEPFSKRQARYVKDILNEAAVMGMNHLSLRAKLKAAYLMLFHRMGFQEAYRLYGKYIENWGDSASCFRFDAIRDGKVVKSVTKEPVTSMRLQASLSNDTLTVGDTYDVAAVRLRVTDQNGNTLPYYSGVVQLRTEGPITLIGPHSVTLPGGMGGTYIKTAGECGRAALTLSADGMEPLTLQVTISHRE